MFDLEKAVVDWRKQMLSAGIKFPTPLEELESHLREAVEQQMRAGFSDQIAFGMAVREIGQTGDLQTEFAKASETIYEQFKQFFCAVAGIPNYQLATNMNVPNQNPEPRWATYFKSAAWVIPAIFIWVGSLVFVVPKLKEICQVSGTELPKVVLTALALSDFCKSNFILGAVVTLAALVLLEWRARRWPRYRRMFFGITAFSLNLFALILITTMMVFAVLAAANLLHAK